MRTRLVTVTTALTLGAILAHAQAANRNDTGGTASISGSVVRHGTTEIVEGAAVVLIDDLGLGPNRTVNTSASGAFRFDGLRAGRYELAVTRAGSVRGAYGADKPERIGQPIVLAADQRVDNLRVPIFSGAVVSGIVWSPDSVPVARARVAALRKRYLSGGRTTIATEANATTDDRGRYRIFGLPPDDYIIATAPANVQRALQTNQAPPTFFPGTNRLTNAQRITLQTGDEKLDADIRLSRIVTGAVHIRVRTSDDTGLTGMRVQISVSPDNELPGFIGPPLSGTDVVVSDLAPGAYRISASASAAPGGSTQAGVPHLAGYTLVDVAGSSLPLEAVVVLKRLASVSGSVTMRSIATPPRTNVGGARVWLTALDATTDRRRYDSLPNVVSQFAFSAIPPGRYQIDGFATVAGGALQPWTLRTVARDGKLDGRVIEVSLDDAAPLELTLVDDLAVFSGSLLAPNGRPAPPHFIVLIATETDISGAIAAYYGRPAADGSFRIGAVLDGSYAVAVVEDVRPDDLNNQELLKVMRQSPVMTLTLAPGEEKRQNLQIK